MGTARGTFGGRIGSPPLWCGLMCGLSAIRLSANFLLAGGTETAKVQWKFGKHHGAEEYIGLEYKVKALCEQKSSPKLSSLC